MNMPIEFIERMKDMLGDEYDAFYRAFTSKDTYSGIRITRTEAKDAVLSLLKNPEQIPWCTDAYYADKSVITGKHPYHIAGLVYFQEPSATAPVSALPINPGDIVLDLCAAPGGKSTQAARKLNGKGLLIANEIIPKRAEILAENIERCGIKNAIVTNESPDRLAERFPEFFNKIIVDAPCSGEGMFRKEPQAIDEWSIAHTESCAVRQHNILDCAVRMLRPGGYLVYSTCTFAPVENEETVAYLLEKYPDLSLVPIELEGLSDGITEQSKSNFDMTPTKRIFPHLAKGEGHFAALFKKDGTYTPVVQEPVKKGKNRTDETVAPQVFSDFSKKNLNTELNGYFRFFSDHLYLLPSDINLDKLKVVRAGLYLGICKKGRFEPSHALALALSAKDFKNTLNLSCDSDDLVKYLHGETVDSDNDGWTVVTVDGFPIGWGKASGGVLKNHFPKKYRLL